MYSLFLFATEVYTDFLRDSSFFLSFLNLCGKTTRVADLPPFLRLWVSPFYKNSDSVAETILLERSRSGSSSSQKRVAPVPQF